MLKIILQSFLILGILGTIPFISGISPQLRKLEPRQAPYSPEVDNDLNSNPSPSSSPYSSGGSNPNPPGPSPSSSPQVYPNPTKNVDYNSPSPNSNSNNYNRPNPNPNPTRTGEITILRSFHDSGPEDGSFSWGYENSDGTQVEQKGYLKNAGSENAIQVMEGFYTYYDPTGKMVRVTYIADENGYRVLDGNQNQGSGSAPVPANRGYQQQPQQQQQQRGPQQPQKYQQPQQDQQPQENQQPQPQSQYNRK